MIQLPRLAALLLAAAPAIAQGQYPSPPDTPESDSLEAFKARMLALPVLMAAPAPLS